MLLTIVVDDLCNELAGSGDENNFSVRSDRHDSCGERYRAKSQTGTDGGGAALRQGGFRGPGPIYYNSYQERLGDKP